jgi:hypothetical protein
MTDTLERLLAECDHWRSESLRRATKCDEQTREIERLRLGVDWQKVQITRLQSALDGMLEEFASNFPDGENSAVDEARRALGRTQ